MAVAMPAPEDAVRRRPWRYWLRQGVWAGLDLLFPPRCAGCHRPGARLCKTCQAAFNQLEPPWCDRCGLPVQQAGRCGDCSAPGDQLAPLTGIRSLAYFDGALRSTQHQFKYRRDSMLADALGCLLSEARWWNQVRADRLVAVPLSEQRLRQRGYNQAGLLARAVADCRGLPLDGGLLRRTRHTAAQVGLSVAQRRANVQGAFAATASARGRSFVVIDDVCTTGATLAACAAALMEAGAVSVWGVTLARARRASSVAEPTEHDSRWDPPPADS
jgi:ComF family protein